MKQNPGKNVASVYSSQSSKTIRRKQSASSWKPLGWLPKFGMQKKAGKKKRKMIRYEAPSVIVRSTNLYQTQQPSGRHLKAAVKPRKDVRLRNPQGAIISLPSLPRVQVGWRLLSLIITAGLGFAIYFVWTTPLFKVDKLEIYGLQRISEYEINSVLQIEGKPSFALAPAKLSETLQKNFPEFSSVETSVSFPASVVISVTERIPMLVWQVQNEPMLIDQEGMAYPLRENYMIESLPLVEANDLPSALEPGIVITNTLQIDQQSENTQEISVSPDTVVKKVLSQETIASILSLVEQAPEDSPIIYSNEHGFGWRDAGGWEVYFGDAKNIPMKLRVYHAIIQHLDRQDTRPALISVEWVDAPYYRLEP